MKQAHAFANANIALIKYWGKNEGCFNIPAVSSLSMTLNDFGTSVSLVASKIHKHQALINNKPASLEVLERLDAYLEQVRCFYPFSGHLHVSSKSNVPFKAGLASSAAFFAALAVALDVALALGLDQKDLSRLARLGSGSAARSIFGGFCGLHGGPGTNHEEAFAFPLEINAKLNLAMVIAIVDEGMKPLSSRAAMNLTKKTSPFFNVFVKDHDKDLELAKNALKTGSFVKLGEAMECSTLKMFATMWTALPSINYWRPQSLALIETVYELRKKHGPKAFFTMDAGPNVKILCEEDFLPTVLKTIIETGYARDLLVAKPGSGAFSSKIL